MISVTGRPYDVITFDCYGTLIDWEHGIADAFAEAAAEDGVHLDAGAVLRAYAQVEPEVERERYRLYREVLPVQRPRGDSHDVKRALAQPLSCRSIAVR